MKMRMLLLSLGKSKWTEDHKTSYLQFDSVLLEKIGHLALFHATIFPILHTSMEKEIKRAMKLKDLKILRSNASGSKKTPAQPKRTFSAAAAFPGLNLSKSSNKVGPKTSYEV